MNSRNFPTVALFRLAAVSLVFGAVALAAGRAPVASAQKVESQVKLTAAATQPDAEGRQLITITMSINKDWHIYANPVQNPDLDAVQTTVKIASGNKLQQVKINYPPGKRVVDGKETYYSYEDKVEITATVQRAAGDAGPLNVSVKYMTCNDKTKVCLLPEQVMLQVK